MSTFSEDTSCSFSSPNPIHWLAELALDATESPSSPASSFGEHILHSEGTPESLHIACDPPKGFQISPQPLRRSNTSNSTCRLPCNGTRRRLLRYSKPTFKVKLQPRSQSLAKEERKRRELRKRLIIERASKIRTVDNSPANEEQLHLLKLVYDEITSYPPEYWMSLIANVIYRSPKQVKNWFSNERQKSKAGETIAERTEDGDKVRFRPFALALCEEWSDELFEGVIGLAHLSHVANIRSEETPLNEV